MTVSRLGWMALALLSMTATGAAAQQWRPDPKAPMDYNAKDEVAFNQQTCTTNLRGNVRVTQGKARLLGQTVSIRQAKRGDRCGQISRVELDRDVYYVTPDASVRADHAVYDLVANIVTFTGEVIVIRGKDVTVSKGLVVNLETNETRMTGPVRAVVYPEQTPGAAR